MSNRVIIDLPGIKKQVAKLAQLDMARVAVRTLELNSQQIDQQKDVKDKKFKPYSAAYAKAKRTSPSNVDLISRKPPTKKQTGHMLTAYGILNLGKHRVELGIKDVFGRMKALWITNGRNSSGDGKEGEGKKPRHFIGLNQKNRNKLLKFVYKLLTDGTK